MVASADEAVAGFAAALDVLAESSESSLGCLDDAA
jgi:hypothetical protein